MTDERLTDEELDLLLASDAPTYFPPGRRPRDRDATEVNLFDYEQGLCVFGCRGVAVGQEPTGHQPGCLLVRLVAEVRRLRAENDRLNAAIDLQPLSCRDDIIDTLVALREKRT